MERGIFITFEGTEGCGKTTQLKLLAEALLSSGFDTITTREPGGCDIADKIRGILLNPENLGLDSTAELLLFAAARAQHVGEVIRPALEKGQVVLCDRFTHSTSAFQGHGRGLDHSTILWLNKIATGSLRPHLTLILDVQVEEGLRRAQERNGDENQPEARFDNEQLSFHKRVRSGYDLMAENEDDICKMVDGTGTVAEVANRIADVVTAFIGSRVFGEATNA